MGDMAKHFDRSEFVCKCGCGKNDISQELVDKLEDMHTYFSKLGTGCKSIIISSGCRCPTHSIAVGGYANDAHTKGIAADIIVNKSNGVPYLPETVAAVAEYLGFSGIGVMAGACHVDIRNKNNYVNSHWYGDEITGENIKTFANYLPVINEKHKITVNIDGKTVLDMEV